jgi:sugar (pentulose or hexulose) kinase
LYFLAIDLGAQSIKATMVDDRGKILIISQEQQEVVSPFSGWVQQKPQIWWTLTEKAIGRLIKKSPISSENIRGIFKCDQMHGPVGIRMNDEITIEWTQIWMDKRCEDICSKIRKQNK